MLNLVLRRLVLALLVLAVVSIIVFVATELLPGDVATAYFGREATEEKLAEFRASVGLDRPAGERYIRWMSGLLHGDLGKSMASGKPISNLISFRLRNTFVLGILAGLIGFPLAIALGIVAGINRDRLPDVITSALSIFAMTLPEFVTGTLLIYFFSLNLKWLPAVTIVSANSPIPKLFPNMVLPIVTLVLAMVAHILRIVRTNMIDVLSSDYVRMATLRGIPRHRIILFHALPNSIVPAINVIAGMLAWLLGGIVVVEAVFNFPGIGSLMLTVIHDRDIPLIETSSLILAGIYITVNLFADLLTLFLNPRLRTLKR